MLSQSQEKELKETLKSAPHIKKVYITKDGQWYFNAYKGPDGKLYAVMVDPSTASTSDPKEIVKTVDASTYTDSAEDAKDITKNAPDDVEASPVTASTSISNGDAPVYNEEGRPISSLDGVQTTNVTGISSPAVVHSGQAVSDDQYKAAEETGNLHNADQGKAMYPAVETTGPNQDGAVAEHSDAIEDQEVKEHPGPTGGA